MRKKLSIVEEMRKASGGITAAGLEILVTDDSILNPQIKGDVIRELLKAQEIVMKVMVDIKLNMKEEEQ